MDPAEIADNITLEQALRRANLLAAAAEVSQNITQILDIDVLLPKTVDIICEAYDFYYAGVFLINEASDFAVLRAGRGEPGRIMIETNHKLAVGGKSMIGACTASNEARISLDVDTEKVWYPNPVLPDTRSEMALPLAIGDHVIGAVTVQSVEAAAFSDEDVSSLQAMANQLAIAIDNARQRRELEETHAELLRAKTFEAIATATGDAIHWIGNKAEPIGGSVERIRQDTQLLVGAVADLLRQASSEAVRNHALPPLLFKEAAAAQQRNPRLADAIERLKHLSPEKLEQHLSLASILEDLQIVDNAAGLILKVKEELIGPAREHAPRPTMIDDVLKDAISSLSLPPEIISLDTPGDLPLVLADPRQLHRLFANLLKNASESTAGQPTPQINLSLRCNADDDFVTIDVADNGAGIAAGELDKIWGTFHTTKSVNEHPGLGLPACRLILEQIGGHISVDSQAGQGATFTVAIPAYRDKKAAGKGESGRGKILLIDDDDHWRHFAKAALESAGYKVTASEKSGRSHNYFRYELILVDDILAEGDSLDILQAIKNTGAISRTVVVSSNPRVERTRECKLLGIRDLLPKPYTQTGLLAEVKNSLTSIRSSQA